MQVKKIISGYRWISKAAGIGIKNERPQLAGFGLRLGKYALLLLCGVAFSCGLNAQVEGGHPVLRENEKGETIIVFPDGRWQYFNRYQQGDQQLFAPGDEQGAPAESNFERYPVFSGKVAPFEEPVPMTEEIAHKILDREAQLARSAVEITQERAAEAASNRRRLEQELAAAQQHQFTPEQTRQLEIRLQAARQTERATQREAQQAETAFQQAEEFASRGNYQEVLRNTRPDPDDTRHRPNGSDLLTGNFYDNIAFLDKEYTAAGRRFSTLIHPPAPACRLTYDGLDEQTGLNRRDVEKQLLFTHTDERLRLYLKDKDYLRCEGYLTALAGGYRYLSLEFTFAYPNAREAYGFIEKGSYLVINLLDGRTVYLQSGKMDSGSYDTEKELLTYRVNYPMNQSVLNTLAKGEVDSMRMYWSSGFEEYEIYYLDFFRNQIRCLEE